MKKIISVFLGAAVLALTATGCAGNGSSDSTPDTAVEINEIPKEADVGKLPSKFDLRNVDGKSYVTSVKSQLWGDCWAFSLAGSAEIAYLYANGMDVPAGKINDKVNFSEKYIVNYMFHGVTKWTDMTERKDSLLETAYKQCAEGLKNKDVPKIELDKTTFVIDNYPIKAICSPDKQ